MAVDVGNRARHGSKHVGPGGNIALAEALGVEGLQEALEFFCVIGGHGGGGDMMVCQRSDDVGEIIALTNEM